MALILRVNEPCANPIIEKNLVISAREIQFQDFSPYYCHVTRFSKGAIMVFIEAVEFTDFVNEALNDIELL